MNSSNTQFLCSKCKGFFASAQGLCSVCYNLALKNNVIELPVFVNEEKKEDSILLKVESKVDKQKQVYKAYLKG